MKSWRALFGLAAIVAAVPLFGQDISTGTKHGDPQNCSDINISIGDGATVRDEQRMTFPASEVQTLTFASTSHTGIHVTGWDSNEYSVVACKAAGADDEGEAKSILNQVQLQRSGGTLSVTGPDQDNNSRRWTAILLVKAPRNAALNLRVKNGPMSLSGMTGTGTLEAKNGPISLKDSAGQFEITAKNGPISIQGRGGRLKLTAHNGPIEVNINGEDWNGDLSGEAHNGPIQLRIPRKFNSGLEVSNARGPMQCRADLCAGNEFQSGDGDHHLRLGSGNAVIRLSTENGPVSVMNREKL